MKITIKWLKERGACKTQQKIFRKTFPGGAQLTLRNLEKASEAELYLGWLVNALAYDCRTAYDNERDAARQRLWSACLPVKEQMGYDKAHVDAFVEYEKECKAADAWFNEVVISSREHDRRVEKASRAYHKTCTPIDKAYDKAIRPLMKQFHRENAAAAYAVLKGSL